MPAEIDLERERPSSETELDRQTRAERLREAVESGGGRQTVADRAGMPVSTLSAYLRGGEMKMSNAAAIARATGVRLEWLALGTGPRHDSESGVMETGAEMAGGPAPGLFASVNMDTLAAAYAAAIAALHANGHVHPEPRRIVQVMTLLYDQLAAGGELAASLSGGADLSKDH